MKPDNEGADNKGWKEVLLEETIEYIGTALVELNDALWILDIKEAYNIIINTIDNTVRILNNIGLSPDDLIREAKRLKREAKLPEPPSHEVTILAPMLMKLRKMHDRIKQMLHTPVSEEDLSRIKRIKYRNGACIIIHLDDIYIVRCKLPSKPLNNAKLVERKLKEGLRLTSTEIAQYQGDLEARIWLQNMLVELATYGTRLQMTILTSPETRENSVVRGIVEKILSALT